MFVLVGIMSTVIIATGVSSNCVFGIIIILPVHPRAKTDRVSYCYDFIPISNKVLLYLFIRKLFKILF